MREPFAIILPALTEQETVGTVVRDLLTRAADGEIPARLASLLVVDNGSTDATAAVARDAGAQVVSEPRRGYGRACLAGIAALPPDIAIVVFADADGSDDPSDLPRLLVPLLSGEADFVLGSRVTGSCEPGALTPQQQVGNWLATRLMRLFFRARYTDLGPFRAIRRDALDRLQMRDTNFGWTIEMQIKAHRAGLRTLEIPVRYRRRRAGASKVAGSFRGSLSAGFKILWTILRFRLSL